MRGLSPMWEVALVKSILQALHILWQGVPYALEAVAIIHQPVIYSHRQKLKHVHTMQTKKCKCNLSGS